MASLIYLFNKIIKYNLFRLTIIKEEIIKNYKQNIKIPFLKLLTSVNIFFFFFS